MPSPDRTQLETALQALGQLLQARGHHVELVIIGGGNLILRGLVSRPTTRDIDLLGQKTAEGVGATTCRISESSARTALSSWRPLAGR